MDHGAILQDISNKARLKRLEGKSSRVRRHRPYCHRESDNEDYGRRTGLLIPRIERDADGFEPFDKLLELMDKLHPWYTDISRILPLQQSATRSRDSLEGRRTTKESSSPDILTIEPPVPVVFEENHFPFIGLFNSPSDKTLVDLEITDQDVYSPRNESGALPKIGRSDSLDNVMAQSINLNPGRAL